MTRRHEPVALTQPAAAAREEPAQASAAEAVREVCDPVAAILISAEAAKRWLSGDAPNLAEARDAIDIIVGNSRRAVDALIGVRNLVDPPLPAPICRAEAASTGWNSLRQDVALAFQRIRRCRFLLVGSA